MLLNGALTAEKEKDSNVYFGYLKGAIGRENGDDSQKYLQGGVQYQRLFDERFCGAMGVGGASDAIAQVD